MYREKQGLINGGIQKVHQHQDNKKTEIEIEIICDVEANKKPNGYIGPRAQDREVSFGYYVLIDRVSKESFHKNENTNKAYRINIHKPK
ncbi:hypothetical protein [Roseicyclus sp.]|uniref:hypothetical protein n=1 Tax=Roseicyclus sp. TaxID=1914329 RepID=UPI003F6D8BC1